MKPLSYNAGQYGQNCKGVYRWTFNSTNKNYNYIIIITLIKETMQFHATISQFQSDHSRQLYPLL
jgi:hypothetical protein